MGSLVFSGLKQFSEFCSQRAALVNPYLVEAVRVAGQGIYIKAQSLFGKQDQLLPHLSSNTITMREHRWGYYRRGAGTDPNATLLWTGGLRQSLEFMHEGLVAGVGSPSPVMQYQELGTARIPARPLLRIAAQQTSTENWLVVRHYAAALFSINVEGGGTVAVASATGENIANQFSGSRKALSRYYSKDHVRGNSASSK